ncbi:MULTISPECIES: GNAT family N-acetyltransferase [unclassified Clostridioides]|uniref:GNAT family N-acetyltransferase n=1 Tax=unclassified Clostridioides TaxID=2635829 RepID=UPI001D0FFC3B|nr:GNAT family N-acetyltransferase [Clostridioides sp. ES-S-0171-01]MCC0688483.1 GNAT family N-acetyltransferase [Clostridioides sp. ES-S-0056-01]MCC0713533.1 GNAT family N-acetyltransferase [Clostridioides sp. ES-S-0077-01]UDN55523.1 GNAT family N-acetyltransferase [Clostridioides sp. ES-S-0054-01]
MNIKLNKWTLNDKESLISLCNLVDKKYLSNRIPSPYTKASADWWLNMVLEHDGKDGVFRSITVDENIVGNISIEQKSDVYEKDAEIGYLLLTSSWSNGIMTEAVKKICDIAFLELDIIRITGLVYEPNIASRRVLEKNNFSLEGIMKKAVVKNDKIYNLCIYGLTK